MILITIRICDPNTQGPLFINSYDDDVVSAVFSDFVTLKWSFCDQTLILILRQKWDSPQASLSNFLLKLSYLKINFVLKEVKFRTKDFYSASKKIGLVAK
jgi:hypothetical protein